MPGSDWASEFGAWPSRPKRPPKSRQGKAPEPPPPPPLPPRPRIRRSFRRPRSGAWKVAYADFVTALMSLFIVLWMMNSSTRIRDSVSGYFHDPKAYARRQAAPTPQALPPPPARPAGELERRLQDALQRLPDFEKMRDHIQVSVTAEGLRIDLLETEQGMFFLTGSPTPTAAGERLLAALAAELGRMGNRIVIEGHTDSRPYRGAGPSTGYSNWELSADRANAARRLLHASGVPPGQVVEIRGFADRQLMRPATPADPRNRRISIVVKF